MLRLRASSALPACITQVRNKLCAFRARSASSRLQRGPRRAAVRAPADITARLVPHMARAKCVARDVIARLVPHQETRSAQSAKSYCLLDVESNNASSTCFYEAFKLDKRADPTLELRFDLLEEDLEEEMMRRLTTVIEVLRKCVRRSRAGR